MKLNNITDLIAHLTRDIPKHKSALQHRCELENKFNGFNETLWELVPHDVTDIKPCINREDNYIYDTQAAINKNIAELKESFSKLQEHIPALQDISLDIFVPIRVKNSPDLALGKQLPWMIASAPIDDESQEMYENIINVQSQLLHLFDAYNQMMQQKLKSRAYTPAPTPNEKPIHFSPSFSNEELDIMFRFLIENDFLDRDTHKDNFIYYFSGRGEVPIHHLDWINSKVSLSIFVDSFYGTHYKKWAITEQIFNKKDLSSSFSQANASMTGQGYKNPFKQLIEKLKY